MNRTFDNKAVNARPNRSEKWDKNTKLKALVQALDAELSYNVSLARNVGGEMIRIPNTKRTNHSLLKRKHHYQRQ